MFAEVPWDLLAVIAVVVLSAAVPAALIAVFLRRRPVEDADEAPPGERAREAVAEMTPEERERFRRWMDQHWPRPPGRAGQFRP
jgi:hypothetical protein